MADYENQDASAPLLRNWEGDWPKSIKYIIWNEFCERFAFYGFKTILALFLLEHLHLSETSSTEMVHLFIVLCYAAPLLGAILSDAIIGKYRTILYLSVIYCIGNWVLAGSAIPDPGLSSNSLPFWVAASGLFLIACGTGGIKPCVSAFGGDQIDLTVAEGPVKERLNRQFFSLYYFAVNSGAFISTLLTPVLREKSSYTVAFAVPAALMFIAVGVFWSGSRHYVDRAPEGNVFAQVCRVVVDAVQFRSTGRRGKAHEEEGGLISSEAAVTQPRAKKHWLDAAKPTQGDVPVEDVKSLLGVVIVLLPTPLFWCLYDQQSSKWVFQAKVMNGKVPWWLGGFVLQPDQMQALNPVLVLGMIPIFYQLIYPGLEKYGFSLKPIRRMWIGISFSAVAFIISAILQTTIESSTDSESGTGGTNISMLWQIPQYIVVTSGEIMFSITGLEFAYSEAPASMKAVVQAVWLFVVAGGNLVTVVVVAIIGDHLTQTREYLFFASLATLAALIMMWLESGFVYKHGAVVDPEDPQDIDSSKTSVSTR